MGESYRRSMSGDLVYLWMKIGDLSGECILMSRGRLSWKSGDLSGEMVVSKGSGVRVLAGSGMVMKGGGGGRGRGERRGRGE